MSSRNPQSSYGGQSSRGGNAVNNHAWYMSVECFGTLVYVFLGTAGEGLSYLSDPSGDRSTITGFISFFIWGLALAIGIYISGGYSGGQLNGSVTIGMALVGKLDRKKILPYFVAQVIGGLLGAGLTLGFYNTAAIQSGYVLSPVPKHGVPMYHLFLSPFMATFCFLLIMSGICDVRNMKIPRAMLGLCIGLTYPLVSVVFSDFWSGQVIMNPTADLGMRIINALSGNDVFWRSAMISYFGSFFGAICGSALYTFSIQNQWDARIKPPAPVGRVTTSLQPPLIIRGENNQ